MEQDVDTNAVPGVTTTFTVTPVEQGQKSHVEITSVIKPSPGLKGWVERVLVPIVNPPVYRKELKLG